MAKYTITAKREIFYEFEIEANSKDEALDEIKRIEISEDIEQYAYEWFPLDVDMIEEVD